MYIPDPTEILGDQIESQIDLVGEDMTYPCVHCKRRFPIDEMHPVSAHPAASLECCREDCSELSKPIHRAEFGKPEGV